MGWMLYFRHCQFNNTIQQMKRIFVLGFIALLLSCSRIPETALNQPAISETDARKVVDQLVETHGAEHSFRIERGVTAVANLWQATDGDVAAFESFCKANFIADDQRLDLLFDRLAYNYEHLYGYMNRISLELNRPIHEDSGPLLPVDQLFGAYSPSAHLQDDFYNNKIAFVVALNFPRYSLDEKNELGADWSNRQWGYARLGDYYTTRIPAQLVQQYNKVYSDARLYISEYNIFAGKLLDNDGNSLFPENMKLLSHWNIRDEIKSNYDRTDGQPKQEMLYRVMLRIIGQDIPKQVINSPDYQWNPYNNLLVKEGNPVAVEEEVSERYRHLLSLFNSIRQFDSYYPNGETYIDRHFNGTMEIPQAEVEALFREYAASPLIRQTAQLISRRLGRDLRPYDLWYNGFVGRGGITEDELDKITKKRYPTAMAMQNDLVRIQRDLGFDAKMAEFTGTRIEVDAARGSGHAWRASMRTMPSHLRTRVAADGMDYKGYNIAIHELGHNVEQTISVHFVDNYFVNGIPNTAFTEALAFMYQSRDLSLLGINQNDSQKEVMEVLDIFWDNYEMMGVSLVDMLVWKWMYANPEASPVDLKEAVIRIAKEVWNEYYADVFNEKDIPLLAIYSHMIQSPLYLSNYPYGRLIMFQLEDHIAGRNFPEEVLRIFSIGRITPRHWMQKAVGNQISNQPLFSAVEKALDNVKE